MEMRICNIPLAVRLNVFHSNFLVTKYQGNTSLKIRFSYLFMSQSLRLMKAPFSERTSRQEVSVTRVGARNRHSIMLNRGFKLPEILLYYQNSSPRHSSLYCTYKYTITSKVLLYFCIPICQKFPSLNLLEPTGHVMHHQFNIQQLYALPTLYLCVLYLSENKQRLVPLTA